MQNLADDSVWLINSSLWLASYVTLKALNHVNSLKKILLKWTS